MMGTYLTPDFVERHITRLALIPEGWNAARNHTLYQLDLKMCQIKALVYSFQWGKERQQPSKMASLLESPSRILQLDISLNELVTLDNEGLLPFKNLRQLDASLNKLTNFQGIEVLHHLYSLNLAHNALRHIDGLDNSTSLVELNLSSNNIRDISSLPSLINLRKLNLSSNDLESLEGVSSLPKLEEFIVQRNNVRQIIPITSCLRLRMFDASENNISSLEKVTAVLSKLRHLQVVLLYGNPVERESNYQTDILQSTNIMTLDNISVRPLAKPEVGTDPVYIPRLQSQFSPRASLHNMVQVQNRNHADNILSLKDAARQAFEERMRGARAVMEEKVDFFQRRIRDLQSEYREFEYKMKGDLEVCLRYLDTLSSTEAGHLDHRTFDFEHGTSRSLYGDMYYHRGPQTPPRNKVDYTGVKDTDEVLKCAYKELARDQNRLDNV